MFWSGLLIVLSRLGLGSISAVLSCSVPEQRLVIEPRLGLEMLEDITFDKATLQSEDKSIQIRSDQPCFITCFITVSGKTCSWLMMYQFVRNQVPEGKLFEMTLQELQVLHGMRKNLAPC